MCGCACACVHVHMCVRASHYSTASYPQLGRMSVSRAPRGTATGTSPTSLTILFQSPFQATYPLLLCSPSFYIQTLHFTYNLLGRGWELNLLPYFWWPLVFRSVKIPSWVCFLVHHHPCEHSYLFSDICVLSLYFYSSFFMPGSVTCSVTSGVPPGLLIGSQYIGKPDFQSMNAGFCHWLAKWPWMTLGQFAECLWPSVFSSVVSTSTGSCKDRRKWNMGSVSTVLIYGQVPGLICYKTEQKAIVRF